MKNALKNTIKKLYKPFKVISTTISFYLFSLFTGLQVYAEGEGGGLASSKFVTGTTKLINDISTALLILLPSVGGAMIIFFAVRMATTSEDHEKSKYKKNILTTLVCVVIGLVATGIVSAISFYYK